MRKIFTKQFNGLKIVAGPTEVEEVSVASWLAQEDIEIVGVSGHVLNVQPDENDGHAFIQVELSQTAVILSDGGILVVNAAEHWNTAPAGVAETNANVAVAFPAGYAIPVKEEGHLYINIRSENKTAGFSTFRWGFIVYYTKKGH